MQLVGKISPALSVPAPADTQCVLRPVADELGSFSIWSRRRPGGYEQRGGAQSEHAFLRDRAQRRVITAIKLANQSGAWPAEAIKHAIGSGANLAPFFFWDYRFVIKLPALGLELRKSKWTRARAKQREWSRSHDSEEADEARSSARP
jgi:hypothetical protein